MAHEWRHLGEGGRGAGCPPLVMSGMG